MQKHKNCTRGAWNTTSKPNLYLQLSHSKGQPYEYDPDICHSQAPCVVKLLLRHLLILLEGAYEKRRQIGRMDISGYRWHWRPINKSSNNWLEWQLRAYPIWVTKMKPLVGPFDLLFCSCRKYLLVASTQRGVVNGS